MKYQITFKTDTKTTLKEAFRTTSLYHSFETNLDLHVGATFPWIHRDKDYTMIVLERQDTSVGPILLVEEVS